MMVKLGINYGNLIYMRYIRTCPLYPNENEIFFFEGITGGIGLVGFRYSPDTANKYGLGLVRFSKYWITHSF
jgi:hypothetical protein